jgi:hypothetical protein
MEGISDALPGGMSVVPVHTVGEHDEILLRAYSPDVCVVNLRW